MQDQKNSFSNNPTRRPIDMRINPRVEVQKKTILSAQPAKKHKRWLRLILGVLVIIILVLGTITVFRLSNLSSAIFVGEKTSFYQKIKDLINAGTGNVQLRGEDLGQINILVLGIGGEGHDGPYLTDTIMLAQVRPDIQQISLTSIPRDYLIELPNKSGQRKINAAFAEGYSQSKDFNTAGQWAREAAEKVSGLTIPYFAVVDFKGFQEAIDLVGGVDVTIDNTFTDYTYPDGNYGYLPPVTFKAGQEHMNGKRALIFARSRHAAGGEGSDYARSQRQQKVIEAFKSKLVSLNIVSDANKINELFSVFANHFHTNISPGQIFHLYSLVKDYQSSDIISISLDPTTKLICPETLESNGAFVLVPCAGKTTQDIRDFFKNSFAMGRLYKEKSVIWLADSAKDSKAFAAAQKDLEGAGLTVYKVAFSGKEPLDQNVVYQVNKKPATTEFIKNTLEATEATTPPPGIKITPDKVDVIIILGKSAE